MFLREKRASLVYKSESVICYIIKASLRNRNYVSGRKGLSRRPKLLAITWRACYDEHLGLMQQVSVPNPLWSFSHISLRKTVGKVSPILVTLTSRNDSDCQSLNVSLKENKPDGVNPNSNDIDYYVRKNEGKIRWFSAD